MKKFVSVQFEKGRLGSGFVKTYQFLTDLTDLALGDSVVVDTANGLQIAYVIGYDESSKIKGNNFKWVVQKINLENHQTRLLHEEKRKQLKQRMEERRKKLEEIHIFELLAKEDPSMKELLDEYNQVENLIGGN